MKNKILIFLLLLIISSCSQQSSESVDLRAENAASSRTSSKQPPLNTSDNLHKMAIQSVACFFRPISTYEITEQHLNGKADSILFVSENKLFKYPLGRFYSIAQVLNKFPDLNYSSTKEDPDSTGLVQVHTFKKGDNTFKMFEAQELPHELVLTSGTVSNPGIDFYSKVHIGMKREDFIKTFFKNSDPRCACIVYSFAYVIDSETQHFTFKDDKLVKIQLTSNYTVQ